MKKRENGKEGKKNDFLKNKIKNSFVRLARVGAAMRTTELCDTLDTVTKTLFLQMILCSSLSTFSFFHLTIYYSNNLKKNPIMDALRS